MRAILINTKTSKDEVLINTESISAIYHVHLDDKHDFARIVLNNSITYETAQTYKEVLALEHINIF